jgi:acyl-CoA thioesterase FadM
MANFVRRQRFGIEWAERDPAGIAFNSRFFKFFDAGAWALFEAALGVKPPDPNGALGVISIPLLDARAGFIAPAPFGDDVELTSHVDVFHRSSFEVDRAWRACGRRPRDTITGNAEHGRRFAAWIAAHPGRSHGALSGTMILLTGKFRVPRRCIRFERRS